MKKRLLLLVIGGLALGSGYAQVRVLTFEEAVRIALRNNILINQQRNNLELSLAQRNASLASLGPNVSMSATAQQFNGNSFNNQEGRVINGVRDAVSGSINANMTLFNGFSNINTIKQANSLLDAQSYFVSRTTQDVISTVSTQYLQVLLDVELLKIASENFEAQAKLLEQVKEQLRLGARSPVDEYNQDALTKGAELRGVLAQITLDNDRALLAQTLLLDPLESFDVVKPEWDASAASSRQLNLDTLVGVAKQHRADYLRAESNERAARYGMAVTRANMLPTLTAFGSVGSNYNFQHDVPDSISDNGVMILNPNIPRPFSEQFRINNVYKFYGVQLTVPLFNGFRNRAQHIQQKVLQKNNELIRGNLENQIRNDVLRAVRTYEGSMKAYSVSVDQLDAANNAFLLETERYNLGVTNFVDYTNANRALVQAQTDKAQAEYRLVFQRILLDYALGTLKPEDILEQ